MLAEGIAQRFIQKVTGAMALTLTQMGSLRVAQLEGAEDEATRAGLRFFCSAQGGTGVAPTQANPSTAAQWLLYNPAAGNTSAFIDTVVMQLASGTAGAGGSVLALPCSPQFIPATVPVASIANGLIFNANPISNKSSRLILQQSQTLQNAAASNWFPIGQMRTTGTVLGQTQIVCDEIKGRLIIPPGCGLALAVISPTGTTPLWTPVISWREYVADLE